MKKALFLGLAAITFASAPLAERLGHVGGSLLLVAMGVLLAWAASESANAMAAGFGAIGAFGGSVLGTVSPAIGAAVLTALVYAERTSRVRESGARVIHVGGALLGGALAGTVSAAYATAHLEVRAVAIVVAAVLVLLPLLIEADDPTAHALEAWSRDLSAVAPIATADVLRRGAELRRTAGDAPLERDAARRVSQTWRSLLRLAEARGRLQRNAPSADDKDTTKAAVVEMLDHRISEHVAALTRAYTAVDTVHAATVGLDDAALRGVDTVGESLEEASQALVEVREGVTKP
ncbi:hypothetical protein LZC95_41150 [Pendulispora brunnea]|uniref:Uncharacterized protein n=1 Tax=Pendulispora brunnea TaxID=2905690 RepID=A0ABZ2K7N4_9BACT